MAENKDSDGAESGHGKLSLWDTVSIIVGIVIGSSIFTTPPTIFENVGGPWIALGVWAFCGLLSFIGALCYAELATTYPRAGGDYVYLTRAFDRPMGFLFGWAQLAVILSSSTGAMAFIFGEYGNGLIGHHAGAEYGAVSEAEKKLNAKVGDRKDLDNKKKADMFPDEFKGLDDAQKALASRRNALDFQAAQMGITAVLALTALNFFGLVLGKWVQNVLVIIKLIGLALILIAALRMPADDAFSVPEGLQVTGPGWPLAMILVLYAFGGWNDAAFVAADLRDRRNITKALLIGTVGVTIVYLIVNFSYILSLGFMDARNWRPTIAADVLKRGFEDIGIRIGFRDIGGKIMSVIVMISALGAMNGLIYTGSRVYLTLGKEHSVFAFLGYWNKTLKSPVLSLVAQALVTISMILAVGTAMGRDSIDAALVALIDTKIPWGQYFGGFNTLYAGGAPVFWIFFLLTGFSMFALRARDPKIERPFMLRAPWYPVLPIIFCGMCLFGFVSAITYAKWISLLGFVPLFLGLPLYWLSGKGQTVNDSSSLETTSADQASMASKI